MLIYGENHNNITDGILFRAHACKTLPPVIHLGISAKEIGIFSPVDYRDE